VGRPRDGDDRVAWLLQHGRFDKALAVCEATRGLKPATHEKVCAAAGSAVRLFLATCCAQGGACCCEVLLTLHRSPWAHVTIKHGGTTGGTP
jgi:hypothetical protein